jgi:hypothetical protein
MLLIPTLAFARGGGHGSRHYSGRSSSGGHSSRSYSHSSKASKPAKSPKRQKVAKPKASKPAKTSAAKPAPSKPPKKSKCATCPRDKHGKIARNPKAKKDFEKQSGYPNGRPGYVVDHVVPLKKGGCDCPSNMQWQTKEAAKEKDKTE